MLSLAYTTCAACAEPVGIFDPVWLERSDGAIEEATALSVRAQGLQDGARLWHHACGVEQRLEKDLRAIG